jgi:DNA-binding helix-hairpin-helix protein with protein kinase domain
MGRHPFAGKFIGKGDMPIPQAIEEFRFAYGSARARVNMEQPPNTPPLSIVGNDVGQLFERAFSNQVMNGGRPGPREWSTALSALESNLKQCSGSASHWYLRMLSACPWCKMEAATGVSLFGLVIQGATDTHFNLDALWREVERIPDPGPAPNFAALTVPASSEAKKVGRNETARNVVGGIVAFAIAGFAISGYAKAFTMILLILAVLAFFLVRKMLDNSEGMQKFTVAHSAAEAKWRSAERDWESRAGPSEFLAKKSVLQDLRRQWQNLPAERLRRLEQLNQQRRQKQLEHFLDRFEIDRAKIEGIGAARKRTLESYGIETAADLTRSSIDSVPGFGPKLRSQLMAWRNTVESRFKFDPSKGVDPQDIAKVEHDIRTLKKNAEDQHRTGLAELKALANRINAVRTGMRSQMEALQREFAQANADYAAVRRTR